RRPGLRLRAAAYALRPYAGADAGRLVAAAHPALRAPDARRRPPGRRGARRGRSRRARCLGHLSHGVLRALSRARASPLAAHPSARVTCARLAAAARRRGRGCARADALRARVPPAPGLARYGALTGLERVAVDLELGRSLQELRAARDARTAVRRGTGASPTASPRLPARSVALRRDRVRSPRAGTRPRAAIAVRLGKLLGTLQSLRLVAGIHRAARARPHAPRSARRGRGARRCWRRSAGRRTFATR